MLEPRQDTSSAGNHHPANSATTDHRVEDVLTLVRAAERDLQAAKSTRSSPRIEDAQHRLRRAVDDARDLGVRWGAIGDALGITRGNAYQRYRHRPHR